MSYHGPHVILTLDEAKALEDVLQKQGVNVPLMNSINAKLKRARESHPDFLKPAR